MTLEEGASEEIIRARIRELEYVMATGGMSDAKAAANEERLELIKRLPRRFLVKTDVGFSEPEYDKVILILHPNHTVTWEPADG